MKTLETTRAFRLPGDRPKIGIRPAIDGRRRGIRESLEGQTIALAQAVASLFTEELSPTSAFSLPRSSNIKGLPDRYVTMSPSATES